MSGAGSREDFRDEGAFLLGLRVRRVTQAAAPGGYSREQEQQEDSLEVGVGVRCWRGSREWDEGLRA